MRSTSKQIVSLFFLSTITIYSSAQKPNIIYILADDLGIGDLGCYGQKIIRTPVIDSLAANGMRFTHHYSGSTVSAPSRCSLLTGLHTGNAYVRGNITKQQSEKTDYDLPLSKEQLTVAEILQNEAYSTACIGKWGLGGVNTEGHPNKQGFDYFFGYINQTEAHNYYPDYLYEDTAKVWLNNQVYSDNLLTEKAIHFIRKTSSPFFLFYAPTLPHAPLDIPEQELNKYNGLFEEQAYIGNYYKSQSRPKAAYAAMVSRFDNNIRQIINVLKEKGITDNTLIIISSDNGAHQAGGNDPSIFNSNGGFRGYKRDLYEGGIRTPMIAVWPKVIEKGTVSNHVSAFWDFLPTVCEIIGTKTPKSTDGISFLPTFKGGVNQKKHPSLYWEFHELGGSQAVLKDNWKLIKLKADSPDQSYFELYNLSTDSAESKNVLELFPLKQKKMKRLTDKLHSKSLIFQFEYEKK